MTPFTMPLTLLGAATLDFDITTVFQFVIFALAIAILHALIIAPYLKVREMREEGTEGNREAAEETEALALHRKAEYDDQLAEARRDAMGVRESLRGQGIAQQEEMVDEAKREVQAKLDEERRALHIRVDELESQLDAKASEFARLMLDRVLPNDMNRSQGV